MQSSVYNSLKFNVNAYSPALWLDASDLSTLFQDRTGVSASTPVASNADPVGTWKDKSGNARHLIAPSDAARPTYTTGAQNSRSGLTFDGVNDVLQLADASVIKAFSNITVIGVVKPVAAAAADTTTFGSVIQLHNVDASQFWYGPTGLASGTIVGEKIGALYSSTTLRMAVGAAYSRSANTAQVMLMTAGSSGTTFYVNGVQQTFDITAGGTTATASGPSTTTITSPSLSHPFFNGAGGGLVTCELAVLDSVLSDSDLIMWSRYLGNKWGITVS